MSKIPIARATKKIAQLPTELRDLVWKCKDNMLIAQTDCFHLDTFELDALMSTLIPEYDGIECTYKGDPSSLMDVLVKVYGEQVAAQINDLV